MYCNLFYIRADIHLEWAIVLDLLFSLSGKLFSYSFLPRSIVKSTSGLQLWDNRYKIVLSWSNVPIAWSHFIEPSQKPIRARNGFPSSAGMYGRNSETNEIAWVVLYFIFHICVLLLVNVPRSDSILFPTYTYILKWHEDPPWKIWIGNAFKIKIICLDSIVLWAFI